MVICPAWVTCAFKILILLVTYVWIITCDELHTHEQNLLFSVFLACEKALLLGQAEQAARGVSFRLLLCVTSHHSPRGTACS